MPRITVYVPDDLKTRMEEAGDDLNWSAITQRAIQAAIATQTLKRNPTDMNSVIERLRASKRQSDEASHQRGKECGAKWAKEAAEYDELRNVWEIYGPKEEWDWVQELGMAVDPGTTGWEDSGWEDFRQRHCGGEMNDAFAHGFVEGAHGVFEEVKDQL